MANNNPSTIGIQNRKLTGGCLLYLGRIVMFVIILLCVGLLITGIPLRYQALLEPCPDGTVCHQIQASAEGIRVLEEDLGVSIETYSVFNVIAESFVVISFLIGGVIVYLRRPNEVMPLIAATGLSLFGMAWSVVGIVAQISPFWAFLINLLRGIGPSLIFLLLYIFPNGHFVPRWTRWLTFSYLVFSFIVPFIGLFLLPSFFAMTLIWLGIGVWSQIYRYRNVSGKEEKQQTKWVVLGFAGFFLGTLFLNLPPLFSANIHPFAEAASTSLDLIYRTIYYLVIAIFPIIFLPISLVFSVMKSRLWNIDPILNRTLVYAGLSMILGLVFIGGFFGLRFLLEALFNNQYTGLSIGLSSAIVAGLFSPTRRQVHLFVDRKIYGINLDYEKNSIASPQHNKSSEATTFRNYHKLELIGRGGMGEVYQGQSTVSGKKVAIKLIPEHLAENEELQKRFIREANTISMLDHDNIVSLHEVGELDGTLYMVMDFIEGKDIGQIMKEKGKIPPAQTLAYLKDITSALDYAHQKGIVHRDIKPGNVMIEMANGRSGKAILMDFGIARITNALTQLTGTGGMVGTLDYISPEQIQGSNEVDSRADIYSLGVMVYQMLTGDLPFKRNNMSAVVLAHLLEPAPDIRMTEPEISEPVAKAIMKAMEKSPGSRFGSAGEMFSAFQ